CDVPAFLTRRRAPGLHSLFQSPRRNQYAPWSWVRCSTAFIFGCAGSWRDSERDVAVVAAAAELGDVIGADRRGLLLAARLEAGATAARGAAGPGRSAGCPADEAHVLRDDLGRVALLAFLVLPLPGAQRSLDQHLAALGEVL